MKTQTFDNKAVTMVDKATTPVGYLAALVTFCTGLTFENWVAVIGILIGLGTLAINWWRSRSMVAIERERLEFDKQQDRRKTPVYTNTTTKE